MKKSKNEISRRGFLKTSALFSIGTITVSTSLASCLFKKGDIAIVADDIAINLPPSWAIGQLKSALEKQGSAVRLLTKISEPKADEFCIVASGMNSTFSMQIFNQYGISAPTEPEALCLVQAKIKECPVPVLLAAGNDDLGLVYALTELADRVNCLETGPSALQFDDPVIERPASRTRSVMRHFVSELEDKPWFYDKDYWHAYLDMLVYSRINRMSFSTGMAYNSAVRITDGYLLFPYPFFLDLPGSGVRVKGLSDEERAKNLEMLKFIGEETTKRGLRFQFGIWTLAYNWKSSPNATYTIEGLTDETHSTYCRDALALLLREVPTISGVTFRVHSESGIPKGSESFWKTQFSAIANCGRRCEIDMHAKNMEPETLDEALATNQPVVISPKYCGEHLGLPYHQASIREHEMVAPDKFTDTGEGVLIGDRRFTRYGYADTLAENRTWDVVFRIWPGTQRFLLNGDPATFAGYGRNAAFCGAAGIELCEPLAFKGRRGSGLSGGRCAYIDQSLNPKYDFDKYRYTYRLWGRLGYNPDADPEIWRRSLRQEFGEAALAVEKALAPVSRVLTLFTLAHDPSADCSRYWPEIYTNLPIANLENKLNINYDMDPPQLFGNVSPLDPQLFMSGYECGSTLVEGSVSGKYTPVEVAAWMESIAQSATKNLDEARKKAGKTATSASFRRMEEDVLIQIGLALFFAAKLRCSVLWRIYELSGNQLAGETAISYYKIGIEAWRKMAERAKLVYNSDISYCDGRQIRGHWMDRIPQIESDIADLKTLLKNGIELNSSVESKLVKLAIETAQSNPVRPEVTVKHIPVKSFNAGKALTISMLCKEAIGVKLFYRSVNQALRWQSVGLELRENNYLAEIPGEYTSKRFPLQYYFEIQTGPNKATFYPPLAEDLSNVPYFVARHQGI